MNPNRAVLLLSLLSCTSCQLLFHDGDTAGSADGRLSDDAVPGERANSIFATSSLYNGNLGGIDGANSKCQSSALAAKLPGEFFAVLSDGTDLPTSRFTNARGWVLTNGAPAADQISDLVSNKSLQAILRDETGSQITTAHRIWTGVNSDGNLALRSDLCDGWNLSTDASTQAGTLLNTNPLEGYYYYCKDGARLLCAENSQQVEVKTRVDSSKKILFVTNSTFAPGPAGRTGADELCAAEAKTVGLPGEYLALLGTENESADTRFSKTILYQRTDGVAIGLLGADPLAAINRGADSKLTLVDKLVWSSGVTAAVPMDWSCNAWTSNVFSDKVFGAYSQSKVAGSGAYHGWRQECSKAARIYCAQK
jgi:hypothetical protein